MIIRMLKTLGGEFPAEGETCEKNATIAARLIQAGYAVEAADPDPADLEDAD